MPGGVVSVALLSVVIGACVTRTPAASAIRNLNPAPFDRGMAMYYGFDYDAAIRWFERAANTDEGSALPAGPVL
jgi:hypothetical protein